MSIVNLQVGKWNSVYAHSTFSTVDNGKCRREGLELQFDFHSMEPKCAQNSNTVVSTFQSIASTLKCSLSFHSSILHSGQLEWEMQKGKSRKLLSQSKVICSKSKNANFDPHHFPYFTIHSGWSPVENVEWTGYKWGIFWQDINTWTTIYCP
jgi:hypothetical protein